MTKKFATAVDYGKMQGLDCKLCFETDCTHFIKLESEIFHKQKAYCFCCWVRPVKETIIANLDWLITEKQFEDDLMTLYLDKIELDDKLLTYLLRLIRNLCNT